jgi:hypothetical protein
MKKREGGSSYMHANLCPAKKKSSVHACIYQIRCSNNASKGSCLACECAFALCCLVGSEGLVRRARQHRYHHLHSIGFALDLSFHRASASSIGGQLSIISIWDIDRLTHSPSSSPPLPHAKTKGTLCTLSMFSFKTSRYCN